MTARRRMPQPSPDQVDAWLERRGIAGLERIGLDPRLSRRTVAQLLDVSPRTLIRLEVRHNITGGHDGLGPWEPLPGTQSPRLPLSALRNYLERGS